MSMGMGRGSRRRRSEPADPSIPKAKFSHLMPYLLEHKPVLSLVIVLSILGSAATLGQPLVVSQVITRVTNGELFGPLVWALIALVVVSAFISGFQHYLLQRTGEGVVLSSRRTLVRRMLHLPISEFDTRRTGDLVSRVGSDTTLLRAVLTQGLVDAIGGALTFVGALIAMIIIDPILLGLTLLVIFVAIVVVVTLSRRIRVASRKAQDQVGELAAAVERAISSVRTIRAANATDREIAQVDVAAKGAWQMGIKVAKISALVVPVSFIAMQVAFLTVLGVGGYRVAAGAITVAQLVAFILFLFMMIMPLGQAFGAISATNSALGALGRIQEIISLPTEGEKDRDIADLSPKSAEPRSILTRAKNALSFNKVSFSYPLPKVVEPVEAKLVEGVETTAAEINSATPKAPVILDHISFTVPHGQRTALVGPSGSGKSTILSLIERFYDPTSGSIKLGSVDIRELDREALRSQIGYVEQDAPVLAGTIADNLRLAKPDATDEECLAVLADVNLSKIVKRDKLGINAIVGENGILLSGGERQRLAIARALLAAPPILLLDESTSSLDGKNEQMMREAIDKVAADRTLVIIAHRLSTVVDCDQIVVLDSGKVIGVGTHSELVKTTPLYRDLAKHQLLV
ncbi:MAG: Multidrug resistance transporter ATP-binding/permease protein BmrA [Actinomycetota bacterium]